MHVIEVRKLPGHHSSLPARQDVRHPVADEAEAHRVLERLRATAWELASVGVILEAHIIF